MPLNLDIEYDRLAEICRRYRVVRLDLFGSRARGEDRPDSDVDLLVTYEPGYVPTWDLAGLQMDLSEFFGCKVDLLTRWSLDHAPSERFRHNVQQSLETLYAA